MPKKILAAPTAPRPEVFRLTRLALRLSQLELARRAGVSHHRIWRYENRDLADLTVDEWGRLERVLRVPRVEDLAALLAVSGGATEPEPGA